MPVRAWLRMAALALPQRAVVAPAWRLVVAQQVLRQVAEIAAASRLQAELKALARHGYFQGDTRAGLRPAEAVRVWQQAPEAGQV